MPDVVYGARFAYSRRPPPDPIPYLSTNSMVFGFFIPIPEMSPF